MRAVVQRVSRARVVIDGQTVGEIGRGLLVLLGVTHGDTAEAAAWLADKVVGLRIFNDADGKMNRGVADVGGGVLVVSQFTLYGDCRKGRRPSFIDAAPPEIAIPLYEAFVNGDQGAGRAGGDGALRGHDAGRVGQRRTGDADRGQQLTVAAACGCTFSPRCRLGRGATFAPSNG